MIDTTAITKLKVRTQDVSTFPFDVVYIVPQQHKALLPRMFPYSLCLPFNTELIKRIQGLGIDDRFTVTMINRQQEMPGIGKPKVGEFFSDELLKTCFMVIPVLARTHQKTRNKHRKDRNPAYLLANGHRKGEHTNKKGHTKTVIGDTKNNDLLAFFNDFATLFTPRGSVRPICKMCPHHLEHIQGKCSLGEQKCHESLIIQPQRESPHEQLQKD